jgi:hypothetical protein
LPPPAEAIDPELEWFYPGWATLSLAAPPPWVGRLGDATELIELSPNVIPRCADRDLPNDTPAFLIVAAVLAAEERGWKIQHAHVMLLMYIEVTPYFIGAVATLSEKSQRWLGRAVWRAWLHDPESKGLIDLIHRLKTHSGLMWTFVEKWIEAEDVESVLRERGCSNLKVLLDILPARFRATAIRCALEAKSPEINVLLFDDKAWRTEDADVLLMIADARLDDWSALRALWRAAPERALARTQEVFHRGEDASHWFFLAPDVFLPSMLELLEEKPPLGPGSAWAKKYLALTLLRSPAYADRIYRLLRRLS